MSDPPPETWTADEIAAWLTRSPTDETLGQRIAHLELEHGAHLAPDDRGTLAGLVLASGETIARDATTGTWAINTSDPDQTAESANLSTFVLMLAIWIQAAEQATPGVVGPVLNVVATTLDGDLEAKQDDEVSRALVAPLHGQQRVALLAIAAMGLKAIGYPIFDTWRHCARIGHPLLGLVLTYFNGLTDETNPPLTLVRQAALALELDDIVETMYITAGVVNALGLTGADTRALMTMPVTDPTNGEPLNVKQLIETLQG